MKCRKCGETLTPTNIVCQKCGFKNIESHNDGNSMSITSNIMMCVFFLPMAYTNFHYFVLDTTPHGADGFGFIFFGGIIFNTLPIILALILGVISICRYFQVKNIKKVGRKISNICNILFIILFTLYYLWINNIFFN